MYSLRLITYITMIFAKVQVISSLVNALIFILFKGCKSFFYFILLVSVKPVRRTYRQIK